MTIDEAVAAFERNFTVSTEVGFPLAKERHDRDWSRAPDGQRYAALTSSGVKPEGERFSAIFAGADLAVAAWAREADQFAAEHLGQNLYWRDRPFLEMIALYTSPKMPAMDYWVVYSRLAIGRAEALAA